jgi:hypothetical protein
MGCRLCELAINGDGLESYWNGPLGAASWVSGDGRPCWIKQTKAYSPWSNFAELANRELKKGCARKMIKARVPKHIWDECLEMESYICSNTYNGHLSLKGETPEMAMSGEMADTWDLAPTLGPP